MKGARDGRGDDWQLSPLPECEPFNALLQLLPKPIDLAVITAFTVTSIMFFTYCSALEVATGLGCAEIIRPLFPLINGVLVKNFKKKKPQ
jgi:hypothetical protein